MEVGRVVSDSIFREMFVELGDAVMAALQAAAAQPPAHDAKAAVADQYRQPSRSSLLTERRALEPIRQRYHWRSLSAVRSPVTAGIDFTVVRECGHRQRFRLFENELEVLAAGQWIDALFECFDRFNSNRQCMCVARPQ